MKKWQLSSVLSILFIFSATLHVLAGEPLTWTGCGITKKAFMQEIAAVYEKKTAQAITISGGGATRGIRAVAAGNSDLGGSCRAQLRDSFGQVVPQEQNVELVQVAWDALVAITHPNNPVTGLSSVQLKAIYEGSIINWKDLGGLDKRIILLTRESTHSGVGMMFRTLVFNDPGISFGARSLKYKSTGPLERKVEKSAMSLGMDGISSARKRKVKVLAIDGIMPSKENLMAGRYPLFRPLYITVKKDAPAAVKRVIDFILSDEGQAIISAQGTVNLQEGALLKSRFKSADKGEDTP